MIYQSDKMTYDSVMEVLKGTVNDVLICQEAVSESGNYYTLFVLKDHETVKKLIEIIENSKYKYECGAEIFQYQGVYYAVFPYVKERWLGSFYMPGQVPLEKCGEICMNLVLTCMMSKLPYPLLYLVLKQRQLHLLKDDTVELGYILDLENLDETIDEVRCVRMCALITCELLQPKEGKHNVGYQLLSKKESYQSFGELLRDIRLIQGTIGKQGLLKRIKLFFGSHQKGLFHFLLVICITLIILTLICFVSKAIWGDIPFLRMLVNHFKVIGTETLNK